MSEASIVIKAQDKYSDAIRAMARETKSFNKGQEEMERTMLRLTKNQHKLCSEFDASKKKLTSEKGARSVGQLASVTGQLGIALASQMALPMIRQSAGGWARTSN